MYVLQVTLAGTLTILLVVERLHQHLLRSGQGVLHLLDGLRGCHRAVQEVTRARPLHDVGPREA